MRATSFRRSLAVLTRARHYRPAGKLTTYLWRVVAKRCLNERARLRHRHRESQEVSGGRRLEEAHAPSRLESLAESEEKSPERLLERKHAAAQVRAAILSLPERQRAR
jgi:DNA-directed RNA polymerase specialized sigma24 family protein